MNKKTIAMVGNTSWGMWKFRIDLMKYFVANGYDVLVIAPKDQWSTEFPKNGCRFLPLEISRKGTNPLQDFAYLGKLLQIFLTEKPDVVLTYTIKPVLYGTVAAFLAGVPHRLAITTGLGYAFSHVNLISKITKILYWICIKFANQVWFLNEDDLNTFLREGLVHENKTFLLPGEGVDIDFYKSEKKDKKLVRFTLISRMLWDKGVGLFADCAEEIRNMGHDIEFIIVGPVDDGNPEGIPYSQLEEWNRKGYVKYLGPTDDIKSILETTSCLVHPTYYKEGLPRVLMEACSMGIPCIATDIPGCRDVIQHRKNGLLIKPNNKDELMSAILEFLELDLETVNEMSNSARRVIEKKFSSDFINKIYSHRLGL